MDYRKLIKFGENSYVISLPSKWIKENKLKKGDLLNVEYSKEGSNLNISLHSTKKEKEIISETIIDYDKLKTQKHLKTHLTAAYINGYDQITIIGKDLSKELPKIREFAKNFIALEIIEQTNQRVILKEFVNIHDISLQEVIRRIDRVIISMVEDTEKHLKGEGNYIESLKQKDADIFKFHNIVFRTIKCFLKNPRLNEQHLNMLDILYYWELTLFLEKFADQIKRIPRYKPPKTNPKIIEAYKEIMDYYRETMKANYTKDSLAAVELINKRKQIFEKCEGLSKYLPKSSYLITEKMKNATNHITYLSKVLIKYAY